MTSFCKINNSTFNYSYYQLGVFKAALVSSSDAVHVALKKPSSSCNVQTRPYSLS